MDRYIVEQAMMLPLFWTLAGDGDLVRVQPWIEGFEMHSYHSGSIFQDVWMNEFAPARTRRRH